MEAVIGYAKKDAAKMLFAAPEVSGEMFRENVEIYACGSGHMLMKLMPAYAATLMEKEKEEGGLYFVFARSFMNHRGPGGPGPGRPESEENFDIVFCLPVEIITKELVDELTEEYLSHGPGPHRGGGRMGGPRR